MKNLTLLLFLSLTHIAQAQVSSVSELDATYLNWYNADPLESDVVGVSTDRAYAEILAGKEPKKKVIVAVLDSGVDIEHEDLKGRIWVNQDEVPGNGIDDDKNGYVDDVHGWNFIGNGDGEHVIGENLEFTRILRDYDESHPDYARAQKAYDDEYAVRAEEQGNLRQFTEIYVQCKQILYDETGMLVSGKISAMATMPTSEAGLEAKKFLLGRYEAGLTEEDLHALLERNEQYMSFFLNKEFDAREEIVHDDPNDLNDRDYGNPDVDGPRADHGTSVAGVIAGVRGNSVGIDGVASNVLIMPLRAVPNGDERDKDIALGIMYAVDNGADIVNMSFGKDFSPQRPFVEEAIKYAEANGVLLVHSSGNSGKDIDTEPSFPTKRYLSGGEASNWLSIGASSMHRDAEIAAIFSNYGATQVDFFAPGVNIISSDSSSTYSMNDGTSVASPVVSGVAAIVLAYYPNLSPSELIDILTVSAYSFKKPKKVLVPSLEGGKRKKVKFQTLAKKPGVVNAYRALLEAEARAKSSDTAK